jgi:hypothetical protein
VSTPALLVQRGEIQQIPGRLHAQAFKASPAETKQGPTGVCIAS